MQKEVSVQLLLEYKSGETSGMININEWTWKFESPTGFILCSYNIIHTSGSSWIVWEIIQKAGLLKILTIWKHYLCLSELFIQRIKSVYSVADAWYITSS